MKRYLIALILPAFLLGCASSSNDSQTTLPAQPDSTTLANYAWQLQDARNAQEMLITSLFVQANKPVQLNFSNNRFNVSNTCNIMAGQYSLHENQMTLDSIMSTRKMCADNQIAALDYEVSSRLTEVKTYSITQTTPPTLTLTTSRGDTLRFSGILTPAARYGSEGETIFLEVAPQTVPCNHPLIQNKQCLQIRQIYFDDNGIKTGTPGPWQSFYQDIEGFNFQPGVRNVLRVKRFKIANPPADAPNTAYVLDMIVESQLIKPKKAPCFDR